LTAISNSDTSTGTSIAETAPAGTYVGITAHSTDPGGETVAYSLTNSHSGYFQISSSTGAVSLTAAGAGTTTLSGINTYTGGTTIDAYVTEVLTIVPAAGIRRRGDLLVKDYQRLFRARVPLPEQAYAKITFSDPWSYAELGEAVEAWGCRYMQDNHRFMDRDEIASRWFTEEYRPVVRMLRAADMIGSRTEAEAYMRVAAERYRLIRTHQWNDEIIERLRRKVR